MSSSQVVTLGATHQQNGISNFASGSFSTDSGIAADYAIYLGFKPRYVKIYNVTDAIEYEWADGMANPGGMQYLANGAQTYESTEAAGITIFDRDSVEMSQTGTVLTANALVSDPGLVRGGEHTNVQGGVLGGGFNLDEDIMVSSK